MARAPNPPDQTEVLDVMEDLEQRQADQHMIDGEITKPPKSNAARDEQPSSRMLQMRSVLPLKVEPNTRNSECDARAAFTDEGERAGARDG